MAFKSIKVTRLSTPTRQSAFTLHPDNTTRPNLTTIADLTFDMSIDFSSQYDFGSNNFTKDITFRSVFIDLSLTDSPIIVSQFGQPSYRSISLQGRTQGWFPIVWQIPLNIMVQFAGGKQLPTIVLSFVNELIPGPVWRTQ